MSNIRDIHNDLVNIKTALRGIGRIDLNPVSCVLASTGGPMAVFANGASATPGQQLTDSKTLCVRWNNNGTLTAIGRNVALPSDLDGTANMTFSAIVSKTGATVGDATTMTINAYFGVPGDLHDADTDCGGVTAALQGDLTAKTTTKLTRTIAAADVPDNGPGWLAIFFGPTGGTLGTDDFCLHTAWLEYTRKATG